MINSEFNKNSVPFLIPDMPEYQEFSRYLAEIDHNQWYSNQGPLLDLFEKGINDCAFHLELSNISRVVACSSGTSALELALISLDLPKGSKVMVPSFTFAATVTAIIRAGYEPVFVDVDKHSWMLTPKIAQEAISHIDVAAVLPVCTLGMPYINGEWDAFCQETGLRVVMDAAAAICDQKISTYHHTCFSLHATKFFGVGEGGVVVSPSDGGAKNIRALSNFGFSDGLITQVGSNYKMSEYHAAVGLAQLSRWSLLKQRRKHIQKLYRKTVSKYSDFFSIQRASVHSGDAVTLMPTGFQSAAALIINKELNVDAVDVTEKLRQRGIASRQWYTPGLHKHPAFDGVKVCGDKGCSQLTVTESLNDGMVGLPYHNHLTEKSIDYIVNTLVSIVTGESISNVKRSVHGDFERSRYI